MFQPVAIISKMTLMYRFQEHYSKSLLIVSPLECKVSISRKETCQKSGWQKSHVNAFAATAVVLTENECCRNVQDLPWGMNEFDNTRKHHYDLYNHATIATIHKAHSIAFLETHLSILRLNNTTVLVVLYYTVDELEVTFFKHLEMIENEINFTLHAFIFKKYKIT